MIKKLSTCEIVYVVGGKNKLFDNIEGLLIDAITVSSSTVNVVLLLMEVSRAHDYAVVEKHTRDVVSIDHTNTYQKYLRLAFKCGVVSFIVTGMLSGLVRLLKD